VIRTGLVAILLAACATSETWVAGAPPELAGQTWIRTDDEQAAPHPATLRFDDARITGHAGCNRFFADVAHAGARLRIGAIGATRMMCPPPAMATERSLFAALERASAYRRDDGALTLLDANGATVARFTRSD